MPIIVFQHAPSDGLGRLGPILRDHAHKLDIRRLDQRGAAAIPGDFDGVTAVISLGGPQNVGESHPWMQAELAFLKGAHARQIPLIGLCLGSQLIAHALGGEVGPAAKPEFGFCRVSQAPAGNTDIMLAGIAWNSHQFQAHAHEVKKLPPDALLLASSKDCKVQCYRVGLRTYGFQYHFECDREDVEAFGRDSWCKGVMQSLGMTDADLKAQTAEHYESFARLGDRLCGNLASFMFPAVSRMRV